MLSDSERVAVSSGSGRFSVLGARTIIDGNRGEQRCCPNVPQRMRVSLVYPSLLALPPGIAFGVGTVVLTGSTDAGLAAALALVSD